MKRELVSGGRLVLWVRCGSARDHGGHVSGTRRGTSSNFFFFLQLAPPGGDPILLDNVIVHITRVPPGNLRLHFTSSIAKKELHRQRQLSASVH